MPAGEETKAGEELRLEEVAGPPREWLLELLFEILARLAPGWGRGFAVLGGGGGGADVDDAEAAGVGLGDGFGSLFFEELFLRRVFLSPFMVVGSLRRMDTVKEYRDGQSM